MNAQDIDLSVLASKLVHWLQEKMPEARDLSVSELELSSSGFTNVSIPFTLSWLEAGQSRTRGMLFRGAGKTYPVYPDFKLDRQFGIMQCLQDTNVPVPRVYWMERDERLFGFPFYLMSKLEGIVPSEYPPYHSFGICCEANPEKRAKMWWGTLEAIANVHKLDWKRLGLSFLGVPGAETGPLDQELDYYERYLNWAKDEPQPILEAALAWLREKTYVPERVTLCWGDARLPNTMFDADGNVVGVLDWDMAILGDPESDLVFMLTLDSLLSEGIGVPRLEGFPGKYETVRRYEVLTGWKVRHLFFNEVFTVLKTGIVILKVQKNLLKMGVPLPGEYPLLNTPCTRRLAELLDLSAPGASRAEIVRPEDISGTVQIHLTGTGAGDWYLVSDKGRVTRHPGKLEQPDVTLTVAAKDWDAIRAGELNPFNAWTTGKLQVVGDETLYRQLSDVITKTWDQAGTSSQTGG